MIIRLQSKDAPGVLDESAQHSSQDDLSLSRTGPAGAASPDARESRDLRLLLSTLETVPAASLSWANDVFGNAVATAYFRDAADRLVTESLAAVELAASAWPVLDIAGSAIPYGQKNDPAAVPSRCVSMVVVQETSQSLATPHRPFALSTFLGGNNSTLPFPWWFRSAWKWSTYSLRVRRNDRSPNKITLDRHSSLTDRIQRSV